MKRQIKSKVKMNNKTKVWIRDLQSALNKQKLINKSNKIPIIN